MSHEISNDLHPSQEKYSRIIDRTRSIETSLRRIDRTLSTCAYNSTCEQMIKLTDGEDVTPFLLLSGGGDECEYAEPRNVQSETILRKSRPDACYTLLIIVCVCMCDRTFVNFSTADMSFLYSHKKMSDNSREIIECCQTFSSKYSHSG